MERFVRTAETSAKRLNSLLTRLKDITALRRFNVVLFNSKKKGGEIFWIEIFSLP